MNLTLKRPKGVEGSICLHIHMSGYIPENILDDILNRVNIVEVISASIPLKRAGRNFKANCPFHHEKTPSFMVSLDRQIYHCFGCGESGNAFKFLMRYEHLDFPEAVEFLAKKAGIVLPENKEKVQGAVSISTQICKINELALSFFTQNLNSNDGLCAKNYLLGRSISEETIKLFKLGFALDKWDALINFLRAKNVPLALLEKAGLILEKSAGGYYDRFRNRAIFPIFDIKSKILAFGARLLLSSDKNKEENSLPKYINSPETPIYTKGKNLYGLNFAKDAIRQNDYAIIVEGYLDFIIPYQQGLNNIVASLGTALTEEQVRLLKRYTNNVVMVYDGDAAGQMATLRTLDIFIEEGVNVKVAPLPVGFDPDLFVRKNGIDSFRKNIDNAEKLFDYKLRILKSQYNAKDIEGKAKISSEMLVTINKFNNAVLRSEYVKSLAETLNVKEEALLQELNKIKAVLSGAFSHKAVELKKTININPTEKLLIKMMLEEADLIKHVRQKLLPADFQDEVTCKIVSVMFNLAEQGKTIDANALINHLGDEYVSQVICESAFMPDIPEQRKQEVVDDCMQRLKKEKAKLKRQDLHEQIRLAQHLGDEEKLRLLMQEFHLLTKKNPFKSTVDSTIT